MEKNMEKTRRKHGENMENQTRRKHGENTEKTRRTVPFFEEGTIKV